MRTMRAIRLYTKGDLRVEEVPPPPQPPAGWVRVKVLRAGICGSDIHNFKTGQWITRSPSIAGHEFVGEVLETGAGVSGLAPGDRVAADSRFWCGECSACKGGARQLCEKLGFIGEVCDGCFAPEVNLPERLLHKVPESLAPDVAATAEPFAVALHAVRRLAVKPDEPVLIAGCGPIGGFAAVVLKHLGFGTVAVVDRNRARAERVAAVTGAKLTVLSPESIQSTFDGRSVTAAIDATGSTSVLSSLVDCLGGGGRLALVGISHGTLGINPNLLVERELSMLGCHAFQDEMPEAIAMLPDCTAMIAQLIDRVIEPDDVPAAYARIASGEATGLKTLIRFGASE